MLEHLHIRGTDGTNLVVVYANDVLKATRSREVNPYTIDAGDDDDEVHGACSLCCNKMAGCMQKMMFRGVYSKRLNKRVDACLTKLARDGHYVGSDLVITLQIGSSSRTMEELQNFIRTGRDFASKIVYSPSFELDDDFFEWLIWSAASSTSFTMIEDIGIANLTEGSWSRDVLELLLNEDFFEKLKFGNEKGTPYWEMVMKFPGEQRKVIIQFCQWSDFSRLGQKMRMFLKKAEDTFVNRVDSLITENLTPIIGKNVCF
uniref:Uncharacterized protein n=1 Tax=Globodera rostochiensis TaxID=31243 RepID=A0A914HZX2_GLORO